jgi:CheY-like chemotaxis protein
MREILSALIIYYSKIELLLGRGLEKDGGVGRTEAGRPLGLSQRTWSDWVRHRRASAVNCFVAEASLSTSATLKVLIADDSSSIRRALSALVDRNPNWVVCGEAVDGEEAVRKVKELSPELVLLDLSIPVMDGVRVTNILKEKHPNVRVILMSEQDASIMCCLAETLGVLGIPKSRLALDLTPTLNSLASSLQAPRVNC